MGGGGIFLNLHIKNKLTWSCPLYAVNCPLPLDLDFMINFEIFFWLTCQSHFQKRCTCLQILIKVYYMYLCVILHAIWRNLMLLGCLSGDHDGMLNFDIYFYLHRSNLLEINLFYDKLYYLWVRQIPKYERIGDVLGII